jgi:hypothetical protein
MSDNFSSPFSYYFAKAEISSDRFDEVYDISDALAELNIHEHLDKPYLTGTLAIIDTVDLLNIIDFSGTEYFEVEYCLQDKTETIIQKRFVITERILSEKINDNSEMIFFALVEDIYFAQAKSVITKSFDGKPESIINKLIKEAGINRELNSTIASQSVMRYLATSVTAFDAARIIRDKSSDAIGTPYFFFSSLSTKKQLNFLSLAQMILSEPINTIDTAFTYSHLLAQKSESLSINVQSYNISDFTESNVDNTLKQVLNGSIGSIQNYVNLTNSNEISFRMNLLQQYNTIGEMFPNSYNKLYDDKFMDGLHNFNSKNDSRMFFSQQYSDQINSIHDQQLSGDFSKIRFAENLRDLIMKSPLTISVPGRKFITEKNMVCVGNMAHMRFSKNVVPIGSMIGEEDIYDTKKSGLYLIYAAQHTFSRTKYSVNITGTKLMNSKGTN